MELSRQVENRPPAYPQNGYQHNRYYPSPIQNPPNQQYVYRTAAYQQTAQERSVRQAGYPTAQGNSYARPSYARRDTPFYPPQSSQVPQQEDPFRKIEDPFDDLSTGNPSEQQPQNRPGEMIPEQNPQPQQPAPTGENGQLQDPFMDQTIPAQTQQENPPTQNPFEEPWVPDNQAEDPTVLEPALPDEPTLPEGGDDLPQITGGMDQPPVPSNQQSESVKPVPPVESYPPDAVVPPSDENEAEQMETPDTPTPAPITPEARPMQSNQLYPGQLSPAPSIQQPANQVPMNRSYMDSNVGSPGPYMPPVATPYMTQPTQQPVMPATPYGPSPGFQQASPQAYAPADIYAPSVTAPPCPPNNYPSAVYQQTMPMQPCNPQPMMTAPQMSSRQIPCPGSIETGSYFDRDGETVSSCANETGCYSCEPCSSCCDDCCPPFYLSVFGGGDYAGNLTSDDNQTFLDFDTGGGVGVALGKIQGKNLRTDFEFTYRNSPFGANSSNNPLGPIDGEFNTFSGMTNVYWQFSAFPATCWKPYLGGGIGFVFLDATINSTSPVDSDSGFAYQWVAGMNYMFSEHTDLFVEYREFYADDLRLGGGGVDSDIDFSTSNVFGGIRLKF
jgi:opacity protein-like surface antigen